jgi:hypothetical protein
VTTVVYNYKKIRELRKNELFLSCGVTDYLLHFTYDVVKGELISRNMYSEILETPLSW